MQDSGFKIHLPSKKKKKKKSMHIFKGDASYSFGAVLFSIMSFI